MVEKSPGTVWPANAEVPAEPRPTHRHISSRSNANLSDFIYITSGRLLDTVRTAEVAWNTGSGTDAYDRL
jgi:hypothetical protein